jgi:2-polyprenyl-3-methyl-5-hydroxy-6-metoxy-1,4-benzoquinol methylase
MDDNARYFEANRQGWNLRTPVHTKSAFYNVDAWKAGAESLTAIELAEVGDVRGRNLLHLQCHFGQDTLSWARKGARVTGVDISDCNCLRPRARSGNEPARARQFCVLQRL